MSDNEYKNKCTLCGKKGFLIARIFYRTINKVWYWLCKECWNKQEFYGK